MFVYLFFGVIYLVTFPQAARDAEREKELRQRHTPVQRDLPRPSEVRTFMHIPYILAVPKGFL